MVCKELPDPDRRGCRPSARPCFGGLGHDAADHNVVKMFGARHERRLVSQPGQRADQRKKVVSVHVRAGLPCILGAPKKLGAGRAQRRAGCVQGRGFILDRRHHRGNCPLVVMRHGGGFANPCRQRSPGVLGSAELVSTVRKSFKSRAQKGFQQSLARREVPIEGSIADPGLAGDVPDGRVRPFARQQLPGHGEQMVMVLLRVASHRAP